LGCHDVRASLHPYVAATVGGRAREGQSGGGPVR
jgi:hypothetical protein